MLEITSIQALQLLNQFNEQAVKDTNMDWAKEPISVSIRKDETRYRILVCAWVRDSPVHLAFYVFNNLEAFNSIAYIALNRSEMLDEHRWSSLPVINVYLDSRAIEPIHELLKLAIGKATLLGQDPSNAITVAKAVEEYRKEYSYVV